MVNVNVRLFSHDLGTVESVGGSGGWLFVHERIADLCTALRAFANSCGN